MLRLGCCLPRLSIVLATHLCSAVARAGFKCYDKCKQSDEAWSTQMPLLMSQTVITQPCYTPAGLSVVIHSFMLLQALHVEIEKKIQNLLVTLLV